jgi:hypothetical protein
MNIFINIILFIIILYIIGITYFKLKYKFWSKQPVFHIHNIRYWLKCPGIINNNDFEINKFYDMKNVVFKEFNEITQNELIMFNKFIKKNYLRNKNIVEYIPTIKKTKSYFENHKHKCYLTYKKSNKYLMDNNKNINTIMNFDCVLTSRPLNIYINKDNYSIFSGNNKNNIMEKLLVNYVDYLCTSKEKRKKGIAPKLIYTYAVNSYKHQTKIYLFKRESESTMIVPLTTYNTYLYNIHSINIDINELVPYKLTKITSSNIQLLYDNWTNKLNKQYKVVVVPDFENIVTLINNECYFVYLLHIDNVVYGIYVFRNSEVIYNNNKTIDFICSNSYFKERKDGKEIITDIFYKGFNKCINELINNGYDRLLFENIGDNTKIKNMIKKNHLYKSISSYYFYNYSMIPQFSSECFILQ